MNHRKAYTILFSFIFSIIFISIFLVTPSLQAQAPPDMVLIPGGEFEMGCHVATCRSDELPLHDVYIDSFYMDIYEVTNQQYCDYLNSAYPDLIDVISGVVYKAGSGTSHPYCSTTSAPTGFPHWGEHSRITWNESTFGVTTGKEDHPMLEVSWYGAVAYANWRSERDGLTPCYNLSTWRCTCINPIKAETWLEEKMYKAQIQCPLPGYRLPTEAEWEYAARGGLHSPYRRYPWGDTLITNIANYRYSGNPYQTGDQPWTTPVGFYTGALHDKSDFGWPGSQTSYQTSDGMNGYGLYDMAGNAWEWCNDWYDSNYYSSSPPYDNPRGPADGDDRVLHGASWSSPSDQLRCAYCRSVYPDGRTFSIGFRLVLE